MEQNQMNNYSFLSKIKSHVNSSVVLIVCTILALLCANMPWTSSWYNSLWQNEVSLSIGRFNLFSHGGHPMTLMQVINDFLMAIFFLSVGLEIKREILVGELSSLKKALLPIIGACGGMIVPVVIYALLAHGNPIAHRGLAIPMATDIAFSLGVLAIFKTRVPVGLKVFLAALAVADDLGGIIVIALFYTSGINWIFFTLAVICILVMVIANWRKVRSKAFYLIVGLVLWYMMLNSGIHATIAGVIVAFCVPATLKNGTGHYLERIRNNISKFPVIDIDNQHNTVVLTHDQIHILKSIESAADKLISPLQDLEDNLQGLINWFVIPLFAFANAGVVLKGMAPGELFSGVSLAVMLGLIVGKFVGVFSFSWISVKLKLVSLPQGADWKSFASVCVLCGIGFTVSMFIADLSFSPLGQDGVQYLNQAKFGILSGSLIAALLGAFLLGRNLPKEDNQN
ncbi:MAG: Na+/H+ antiporter NhaA [Bacteroidales bacterium]|nr:Na+/H+ antiporter NhaA [Bacteroidales bacterium]MDY5357576.1 Na+/H+ antiporter NhaA [Candidatus Cryptobacteroides sp.]